MATTFAVEPKYAIHDKIKGSFQILTNTEEFVSTSIQETRTDLEEMIHQMSTNSTEEIEEIASKIAVSSTNYTDSISLRDSAATEIKIAECTAKTYADSTNTLHSVIDSMHLATTEVAIPQEAEDKGVTFVDTYGEDANVGVEIGRNAQAHVTTAALLDAPPNSIVRSVSIAIGAESDATIAENPIKNQAIAIGWHAQAKASNAIAIGSGAQHPTETAQTGNATVASGNTAIAMGYDAKATADNTIALGRSAKSSATGAVQLGDGENSHVNTLQFRGYTLLDAIGQVPTERLANAKEELADFVMSKAERIYKNGNMTIEGNGSEEQVLEPMVNGLSEILFDTPEDGIWRAGGECAMMPPLGSRNYNVLVMEIPQSQIKTNDIFTPLPPDRNFLICFSDDLVGANLKLMLDVSPSVGFKVGDYMAALTNAPCIIKCREPSTNRVIITARPFNLEDL